MILLFIFQIQYSAKAVYEILAPESNGTFLTLKSIWTRPKSILSMPYLNSLTTAVSVNDSFTFFL